MGVGHVPPDPVRPEGEGAHLQGRERRGTALGRDLAAARAARGREGEDLAARWYVDNGYRIITRNWRVAIGEVDIIAGMPGLVVFCEVKSRATDAFGGPLAAVGLAKQRRLRRLAATWLATERPGAVGVRFDVAAITGTTLEMIVAAF